MKTYTANFKYTGTKRNQISRQEIQGSDEELVRELAVKIAHETTLKLSEGGDESICYLDKLS